MFGGYGCVRTIRYLVKHTYPHKHTQTDRARTTAPSYVATFRTCCLFRKMDFPMAHSSRLFFFFFFFFVTFPVFYVLLLLLHIACGVYVTFAVPFILSSLYIASVGTFGHSIYSHTLTHIYTRA